MEIKYKVIYSYRHNEFEKLVSEHLNDGWQLANGFAVVSDSNGNVTYYQTVVKNVNSKC